MSKFLLTVLFIVFVFGSLFFFYSETNNRKPRETNTPITEKDPRENIPNAVEEKPKDVTDQPESEISTVSDLIRVSSPELHGLVSSPVTVTGEARGSWYFEATFPITVVDWDGRIIGEGHATAQDEWMTEEFVSFEGTVTFDLPEDTPYRRGTIIFKRSNPSGLPEHDRAIEIPITF